MAIESLQLLLINQRNPKSIFEILYFRFSISKFTGEDNISRLKKVFSGIAGEKREKGFYTLTIRQKADIIRLLR